MPNAKTTDVAKLKSTNKSVALPMLRVALIAHDAKKAELCEFVATHIQAFENFQLVATGTTGAHVMNRCPQLQIDRVQSGPKGGDQQIGARIAEGKLDMVIFLPDPLTPMPHDVDVKALLRLTWLYNVPCACNLSTATAMIAALMVPANNA
jgi:methylglyoxal synthase